MLSYDTYMLRLQDPRPNVVGLALAILRSVPGGLTSLQLTLYLLLKIDLSPLGHVNLKIELE